MSVQEDNILIILPAYNEASVIAEVIKAIKNEGFSSICIVDDGSQDTTAQIATNAGATVISHPINRGAGAAAQTGITYANENGFQYCVLMDSDGQHLPQDITNMYTAMTNNQSDIVIGNRFIDKSNEVPTHRRFYNRIANVVTNVFCKKSYSDTQSGFRLLNRQAIERLNLKNRGFGFCSEMIIYAEKAGLKISETPIQVLYTPYSMSKGQNLEEGVRTARSIFWRVFFE